MERTTRLRYCLVSPDSKDPIDSVSRVLRESGVRIDRVDRGAARITGRTGGPGRAAGRAVAVSLFPRLDVCFVEIACEADRGSPLEADVEAMQLAGDLRESLPPRRGSREGGCPPAAGPDRKPPPREAPSQDAGGSGGSGR